ncbi:hypothetical protein HYS03_02880 [Candidatus Woesebacteria bacterium]|nr:hypothetical protein [Candidatus Woesebacteria bacterium]
MPENKDALQPAQLWETLSEPEREACIYFAISDWKTGVDKGYLDAMGLDNKDLEELTKRGVVEKKPTWQMFQGLADGLKNQAGAIKARMHENPLGGLDDDERTILQDFDRFQSIADRKNQEPRYHLADQKLHNYINENQGFLPTPGVI